MQLMKRKFLVLFLNKGILANKERIIELEYHHFAFPLRMLGYKIGLEKEKMGLNILLCQTVRKYSQNEGDFSKGYGPSLKGLFPLAKLGTDNNSMRLYSIE